MEATINTKHKHSGFPATKYDPIDYTDQSLYEEDMNFLSSLDKEYYTPEEAYELVMKEIRAIYEMKDAV